MSLRIWRSAGSRGATQVELLLAGVIFMFIALAAGSFYLFTERVLLETSAQSDLQRQGSLMEEELVRHLQRAVAVYPGIGCGPGGASTGTSSLIFQKDADSSGTGYHPCRWCCIYSAADAGNTGGGGKPADQFPQLYLCTIGGLGSTACLTTNAGVPIDEVRAIGQGTFRNYAGGSQIRVEGLSVQAGVDPPLPANRNASVSAVTIRWQLCQGIPGSTSCSAPAEAVPPFPPKPFEITVAIRN